MGPCYNAWRVAEESKGLVKVRTVRQSSFVSCHADSTCAKPYITCVLDPPINYVVSVIPRYCLIG
jgi:positive regulator of sigma E activity